MLKAKFLSRMILLSLVFVTALNVVNSERVVNSDGTVTINLGNYHMPINLEIEEEYILKGNLFEVTREIWFFNMNFTEKINFQESAKDKEKKSYYSYVQYDEGGNVLKRKPYLETNYIKNGTELSVTFPDIDILNKSYYYIKETYNVKYAHWNEKDFWYPFDEFPFNRTIRNRLVTHSYDFKIKLPKTYDVYYNNKDFEFAIESYFADSTFYNISNSPNINMRVCLPEFRPFISSLTADYREVKFPTVVMPSIEEDPCKLTSPKISVFFTIGRTKFLKGIFLFSLITIFGLFFVYVKHPNYFGIVLGSSVTLYLFQQGIVLFFSQNRPTTLTLWDLTGIPIFFMLVIKLCPSRIINKIILLNRQRQTFIRFEFRKKVPKLIIHEKYKKLVKWVLRIVILIGIATSFLTLVWYISLSLAIILIIIEQLFERVIFMYTSLYVQAIPKSFKPSDWQGMVFGIPRQKGYNFILGMFFDTEENARKIFECIEAWNQKSTKDDENNICISFIIESEKEYSTYIYPSYQRKTIIQAAKLASKGRQDNEHHQQLIMGIMFCKPFDYNERSNFKRFKEHYKKGMPFEFGAYVIKDSVPRKVKNTLTITKKDVKIKQRLELTSSDPEYDHKRFFEDKE